jgi:hypothetical protein
MSIKLYYYDGLPGRAEYIRLALEDNKIEYEDIQDSKFIISVFHKKEVSLVENENLVIFKNKKKRLLCFLLVY